MQIYNTLTKQKEEFRPADPNKVKMFVCGPTVYDYIHVGNARTYTVFDMVAKYLRYRGYDVEYIQNITDIDDKIIKRALEMERDPLDYARDFADAFFEDVKKLGIDSVSHYELATKNIDQVIKQVNTLIKNGNAYKIENDPEPSPSHTIASGELRDKSASYGTGGWYFDLKTFPEYGKLSGRTVEMAEDGMSRIDESAGKRNRGDFCLWKFSKPEEPGWDSELGYGRPGWHIEDTSITEKYFGPQYDLHGAGADLIFPHHEAEIAQQESASGLKPFVRYWMHVGFLVNKTQKMSKSLGNFMVLREALAKYRPEVLRFYFLSSHYRSQLDYNEENLKAAEAAVARIREFASRLAHLQNNSKNLPPSDRAEILLRDTVREIVQALDDDFDTPRAIGLLFDYIRLANQEIDKGVMPAETEIWQIFKGVLGVVQSGNEEEGLPQEIKNIVSEREVARQNKDFVLADNLRKEIKNLGYEVDDTIYGPLVKKQNEKLPAH